jgi:hypothetical protein
MGNAQQLSFEHVSVNEGRKHSVLGVADWRREAPGCRVLEIRLASSEATHTRTVGRSL